LSESTPSDVSAEATEEVFSMTDDSIFSLSLKNHLLAVNSLAPLEGVIASLGQRFVEALVQGGKILWLGNGGSAADCQHLAAEFVGRFQKERRGLSSIALTTDTSILTSVGNDYGYEAVFSRQVEALCRQDDVVIGITTSGNSENVIRAVQAAKSVGAFTVGFTGEGGGRLAAVVDTLVAVPSRETARIQECHILLGHILCEYVEAAF
jgi:D-sedoheptulose 7-phosphate isomerase